MSTQPAGASESGDLGIVKDPEVGDHVKIQGQIRLIAGGEAAIKIFRPGEYTTGLVWVQCGALEHVEAEEDPNVMPAQL